MAKRKKTITAGNLVLTTLASMPLPRDPDHVRAEKSRVRCAVPDVQKNRVPYFFSLKSCISFRQ